MPTPALLPSQRVQRKLVLKGRDFRLYRRPYLLKIYDSVHPNKVMMTGRQVEKTTTIAAMMVDHVSNAAFKRALYVAARPSYVSEFSNTRFTQFMIESPELRHLLRGPFVVKNVEDKFLSNMSAVHFRSLFLSPAKARGLPVQFLAIDEMQEMISDHIPVIEECQSHYPLEAIRMYAGTPLTFGNTLSVKWSESTRNMWGVRCTAGHWNFLTMENVGKEGPICGKLLQEGEKKGLCSRDLDTYNGQWIQTAPKRPTDEPYDWDGFHINQLMVPWLRAIHPITKRTAWQEILRKLRSYPERQFRNEVLGEAFSIGKSVLSDQDVQACCENYRFTHDRRTMGLAGTPRVFMGLDWGGVGKSRTAVAILAFTTMEKEAKLRLLDGYLWPGHRPEDEMEKVKELVHKWKVSFVAADHGNGHLNNRLLAHALAPVAVWDFHLSGTQVELMKQVRRERRYVLSRTESLAYLFRAIRLQEIGFPRWQDMRRFTPDIVGMFEEYNDKTRMIRYEHPPEQGDDFCQALNLAHMAWSASVRRIGYRRSKK